ncbi:unnamed protein product [Musa textilis]
MSSCMEIQKESNSHLNRIAQEREREIVIDKELKLLNHHRCRLFLA